MKLQYIAVISFAVGVATGYLAADTSWQAKWDKAERDAATNQLNAVNAAVADYKTKLVNMERVENETKQDLANALLAADNATRKSNSLQQQIYDYLRNGNGENTASSTSTECKTTATDRAVLAELFRRADKRAGDLAAALDQARIAGLACEQNYNNARL